MYKILSVVLLALMVTSPAFAVSPTWGDKNTLKGVKAVCVEANVMGDAAQASIYKVTSSSLKSRVEVKLKEAGIRVAPLDECKRMPGRPYLQVTAIVTSWPGLDTAFLITVDFDLLQDAVLVRDNTNKALLPTWSNGTNAIVTKKYLWESVTANVDSQVKEFSEEYFAVNR